MSTNISEAIKSNRKETMNMVDYNSTIPMNLSSGYETQQFVPVNYYYDSTRMNNPILALNVRLDVSELIKVQSKTMLDAYQLGVDMATGVLRQSTSDSISMEGYMGIYDDESYGVYNSTEKYEKSAMYWHTNSVRHQIFRTYDEAIAYAKNGVAALNGIDESELPPMTMSCNWRQKIFDKTKMN